jgi:hypothetical protein
VNNELEKCRRKWSGPNCGTIPAYASRDWGKARNPSVGITWRNMNQELLKYEVGKLAFRLQRLVLR